MELETENNYAGDIMVFRCRDKDKKLYPVKINISGHIETTKYTVEYFHAEKAGIIGKEFFMKLPENIVPSFYSKHYKILYKYRLSDHMGNILEGDFTIINNNLRHFDISSQLEGDIFFSRDSYKKSIELLKESATEIEEIKLFNNKNTINRLEHADIPIFYKKTSPCNNVNSIDQEMQEPSETTHESLLSIFKNHLRMPVSSFKQKSTKKFPIIHKKNKIAVIEHPNIIYRNSWILLKLIEKTRNINIDLAKLEYEADFLMNFSIVQTISIEGNDLIEKQIEINSDGWGISTSFFKQRYQLYISFDKIRVEIPWEITMDKFKYVSEE